MKKNLRLLATLICAFVAPIAVAQEEISDVFADPAIDFSRPADRARAVERIRAVEQANLERARVKAQAMGVPMRRELPGGGATEIMGLDENGEFIIYTTHNVNAAISTAANLVQSSPYSLNGSGITVGVWDGGAVRTTHQEFATGSRVTVKDGATTLSDHATHVAGTIAAAGVSANAKGMATQARVDSYEWTSDTSEMLGRGATAPGQADKIYVSNHSYGYVEGWDGNTWRGTGTDQNAYDPQFGQYSSAARTWDDTVFKSPYYLPFKSSGNDNSNNPATGSSVVIGGVTVTYDPAIHPKGDGLYRNSTTNSANGYENIGSNGTAKNIMTVGAANDAVTSGLRDPSKSTLTGFSSRGPTDDGRIKPDIVANGAGLYSPVSGSNNTSYGNYSGTSMSSPNAAGSASLLVQLYANLFSGGAMRASTLKGLIIHTATDIGNPGPDYHYGWGLMNTKEAADLIIDHQTNPSKQRIIEDQVTSSVTTKTYSFLWDGSSALRTTMCWTDPPGTSTTSHDLRTPRLVNNLNLKLIAPNGSEYFPYVMPFVGTWTVASMSQNATTGVNNTDNVEQVRIASPGQTGTWQAVVSYTGTLTNNLQNFSLLFSGVSDGIVPLTLNSITPNSGTVGSTVTADITGTALSTDTSIRLRQPGRADIIGTGKQMLNATTLRCQFNLTGAASGSWNLVAINPDAETFTLPDAFAISGTLTTIPVENFDAFANGALSNGWTSTTSPGTNSWTVVSSPEHPSQTPTKSCYVTGPANSSVTYLTSPSVAIPSGAANLQLQFWHQHDINTRHGGRFSISIDNGPWFDVTDTGSGAAFTGNGYNSTVVGTGQTSAFANLSAWTGASNGFIRTIVSFTDIPKYAGKNVRLRWGIATNSNQTSAHWYVDSIAITSDSSTPNQPPVITTAASTDTNEFETVGPVTYHVLRDADTNLSVTASDDAGEPDLSYTWSSSGPAPVTYSLNGNNAAKTTTAGFSAPGDYAITVTALDTGGLSTPSTVNVRVLETSTFSVTPDAAILNVGQTQQFNAALINQFGTPNASQPSPITWSVSGGGTISSGGLFTATSVGGPHTITASGGGYSGTAEISVNPAQAGIQLDIATLNQTYDTTARIVTATTNPPGLSYSISYDGQSTAPINAGSYNVAATITDPNYQGSDSGTLVVAKASQTINFAALDPVLDNAGPFALTATASSGLTVSYASSNTAVATVSGNTVSIAGVGTTTITASQAGNTNYNAAASVPQTLNVFRSNPLAVIGGPYSVLVGQTVTLNGGASEPSYGENITAWEWDLNNDNTFGDATGATVDVSYSDLITNWNRVPGNNTIQLKVTDSSGKTSIASTIITLIATLTWDANGSTANQTDGTGAWLNANQWWTGSANTNWSSSANAIFGNGGAGAAVTLASPTTVNAITFNSFTGTYTLGTSGNTISLNGGITGNANSGIMTIISPVTLGATQTWTNNSANALTTGNGTNLITNGGYNLTVDGTGTTNFGVVGNAAVTLSGTGALIKNGSGRLNAGGLNSGFSGAVTINGGVLQAYNDAGALGNGNLTLNGGVLSFYWGTTYTRTLGTGTGAVQILGGESGFGGAGTTGPSISLGTSVVWGALGQGAATGYFNPGKFVLGDAGTTNAGVITFSSGINLNGSTRTIVVPKGLSAGGNVSTISGAISSTGTAGLIKEGIGNLVLSATNTYNGGTNINEGTLTVTTTGALPDYATAGKVTVAGGAMLAVRTGAWTAANIDTLRGAATWSTTGSQLGFDTSAGNFSYAGNINGAHSVAKIGNNTLTLTGSSTHTGATNVMVGTLTLGNATNTLPDSGAVNVMGGTLGIGTNTDTVGAVTLVSGTISGTTGVLSASSVDAQSGTISAIIGGNTSVTKTTSGTVTLSGANTYSGGFTLNAGTISILTSGTYAGFGNGTVTFNGGTLSYNSGSPTITYDNNTVWNAPVTMTRSSNGTPASIFNGDAVFGGNTGIINGSTTISNAVTFNGDISETGGSRSFTVTTGTVLGSLTFNGQNTFTGNITGTSGTAITVGGSGYLGGGNYAGNISGASFTYSSSADQILSGVISGSSSFMLTKDTGVTSTLKLSGANTYTGVTTVKTGTLQFAKQVSLYNNTTSNWTAAKINVQSGGTLAFNVDGTGEFTTTNVTTLLTNLAASSSSTNGMTAGSSFGFDTTNASGGNFTIGNVIADSTGATGGARGLTKLGAGTLVLSGGNTYTGTTIITSGVLGLGSTGSIAASASVTIGAGASLDASAQSGYVIPASQPVTFGIDASGAGSCGNIAAAGLNIANAVVHYSINGTLDDPVYVLATYTSRSGAAFASVDAPPAGYILNYAYQGNKIALVQDIGPGPVDHFVISAISSPQTVGTPITGITITAEDASNETATSFTGTVIFGGTAGITGTSANFINGVLSGVSVTPTASGSNLTFTVDDGSGHTGSATFTVQTVFQSWVSAQGLAGENALPGANPDNDTLNNLLEFAFGTDPNAPSAGPVAYSEGVVTAHGQPLLVQEGGNRFAVFARRVDHASAGLNYAVRFSADLEVGYWETSSTVPTILATDGVIEAVAVPYPGTVPASGGPKTARFFQVVVTGN